MKGIVSAIRRFSLHDGPGIRTAVFLTGCNLRCAWCHNPETYRREPQLLFVGNKCIGCGECYRICPTGALQFDERGRRSYNGDLCRKCFRCVDACYTGALTLSGREMSSEQILGEIYADIPYYAPSGGGATISGGEPFMQKELLIEVLQGCRDKGIHTCIESNFSMPWDTMLPAFAFTDLVTADIKIADSAAHAQWTGLSNDTILENLRCFDRLGKPFILRTPVIPSVNDNPVSIAAVAALLASMENLLYYELLNYNELAEVKFKAAGLDYQLAGAKRLNADQLNLLAEAAHAAAPDMDIRLKI